jgi:thiamine-phosphate pyrophosphorylase
VASSETARVGYLTRAARAAALRGIYVIVNEGSPDPVALARAALDAGVRVLQYRAKRGTVANRVRALRALTRERGALLLFNDDAEAVFAFDCDGVHLGPDDRGFTQIARVRELVGERLIGLSCANPQEARAAFAGGADYLGIGSVYATSSKSDAGEPIGIAGLRAAVAATPLPAAAIGGIALENLPEVAGTGVAMAAVISALADAPDPATAAVRLVRAWNEAAAL